MSNHWHLSSVMVKNRGVKHTAWGLEAAHYRVQFGPLDDFVKCDQVIINSVCFFLSWEIYVVPGVMPALLYKSENVQKITNVRSQ